MSSGTCWHCEGDHDTGDCPTRKQWTKGEHQPGSPGVDLDELDAAFKVSTLDPRPSAQGRWMTAVAGTWPAVSAELRTLRARVGELEDKAAGYLHAFKDGCERSTEAVAALEARITDLESQLAAAREEQGLEARVAETLGARFMALSLVRLFSGTWRAEWEGELSDVRRPRPVMRAHAADLPALLRAILAVEKGGPDEG